MTEYNKEFHEKLQKWLTAYDKSQEEFRKLEIMYEEYERRRANYWEQMKVLKDAAAVMFVEGEKYLTPELKTQFRQMLIQQKKAYTRMKKKSAGGSP